MTDLKRILIPGSIIDDEVYISDDVSIKVELGTKKNRYPYPYDDFQAICEKCGCFIGVNETAVWDEFGICCAHLDCSKRDFSF